MFKKKSNEISTVEDNDEGTRTVVTKTVETSSGVQTKTTTIVTHNASDFNSAFVKFNLDPEKFKYGGTSVTKKIVYSSSSGQGEVLEETVERYGDPDVLKQQGNGQKEAKASKPLLSKLGLKFSKSPKDTNIDDTKVKTENKTILSSVKPGVFEEDCLKSHNNYRAKHGVPKLKLSKEICAYSKEWADHLAATDTFQHRKERKYGENIFMKWSSDQTHVVSGNEAVDSWYSEIKDHTFGKEPQSLKSGHFTQVIWKESKEMGVAWARSKTGKVLVVANYNPAGNFIGKFAENVPRPIA